MHIHSCRHLYEFSSPVATPKTTLHLVYCCMMHLHQPLSPKVPPESKYRLCMLRFLVLWLKSDFSYAPHQLMGHRHPVTTPLSEPALHKLKKRSVDTQTSRTPLIFTSPKPLATQDGQVGPTAGPSEHLAPRLPTGNPGIQ